MQLFPGLLSSTAIEDAFYLFRNLPNHVNIDGQQIDRHAPSAIGHFLLTKFTTREFDFVWKEVKQQIKDHSLVYCRILKYNRGCYIQPHKDSYNQGQQESDKSLIIQMNPLEDFKGGAPFVNRELIELNPGDGVIYEYREEHEVKPVQKGLRYVINLRLKTDK